MSQGLSDRDREKLTHLMEDLFEQARKEGRFSKSYIARIAREMDLNVEDLVKSIEDTHSQYKIT